MVTIVILSSNLVSASLTNLDITSQFNLSLQNNSLSLKFEKDIFNFDLTNATLNQTQTITFTRQINQTELEEKCLTNYAIEYADCTKKKETVIDNLAKCNEQVNTVCLNNGLEENYSICQSTLSTCQNSYEVIHNGCPVPIPQKDRTYDLIIGGIIGGLIVLAMLWKKIIWATPEEAEFNDEGDDPNE